MCTLLIKTRQMLIDSPLRLEVIAAGAEVKYMWLSNFKANRRDAIPAVDKVQRLYEFLSGKKLEV